MAVIMAALFAFSAQPAQAQMASMDDAMGEISIGDPKAPLTIYEYSSLTCPHCAKFHTEILPHIKKDYVDTGKVRIVFEDFPLGGLATGAMMIVRCSGPERQFDFFDMLYQTQSDWSRAENPLGALVTLARFFGLGEADVTQCLGNQALQTFIQEKAQSSAKAYGINSTPTFTIDGRKIEGALPYDDFREVLDEALAKKGVR